MKKKFWIGMAVLFAVGMVFYTVGRWLDGTPAFTEKSSGLMEERMLEPFSQIQLEVSAAHIQVTEGEDYGVTYQLGDGEVVLESEVRDDTLHFSTGGRLKKWWFPWKRKLGQVNITVPKGETLEQVQLITAVGDIAMSSMVLEMGNFQTTTGEIHLNQIEADQLQVEAVVGDVTLRDVTANQVKSSGTVSSQQLEGNFGSLVVEVDTGDCVLRGTVSQQLKVTAMVGDVDLNMAAP